MYSLLFNAGNIGILHLEEQEFNLLSLQGKVEGKIAFSPFFSIINLFQINVVCQGPNGVNQLILSTL